MSEERRERRDYLKSVLGIAAGFVIGGATGWFTKPKELERVLGPTVTERVIEKHVETIPGPTQTVTKTIHGPTVTKTVTPTPTPTLTVELTPIPTPTPAPTEKVFTCKGDNFELKVTVPSYMSLSTPDDKKPARLDIYLKMTEALSGLLSIDAEGGIKVRLPVVKISLFVDIDLTILGNFMPDLFRLEWPIYGIPTEVMSLETGDVGVYALAVPVEVAEVELESLTVGEWYQIGAYDLYVVEEPTLVALGIPSEDVTIGEVMEV